MVVGIASDHGGYILKRPLCAAVREWGYELRDFGACELVEGDDYPDFVIPLARAVASGEIMRGIAICGSGVGASVAANKIKGIRAGLIGDSYSAHQGVEDDDMNVICLGGRVVGSELAKELVGVFLKAKFMGHEHHLRRIIKIRGIE